MKKLLLIVVLSLFCLISIAQTSNQLIAVHQFNNLAAINAIANPIRGNLAFNLDNGFMYYFDGTNRIQTPTSSSSSNAWDITGNAGTDDFTNFIGTTDNQDLSFRTDNVLRLTLKAGQSHRTNALKKI
ncbi:MAG: hypothetical protein ACON4Y_04395 [Flavobacteriales bacterium]